MRREAGERWACEACGERLVGALTISGKVAPITLLVYDAQDPMEGNVWLGRRKDGTVICVTLSGELLEKARAEGLALHLNHFANCPERARFGKGS
jgi:hypothetical protein